MHGQPPSITVMPCSRPYSVAASETLPAPGLQCIQTCLIPSSAHRLLGDLRARPDHDRFHAARDRAQVVIGRVTSKLVSVRVYGEHLLISALPKVSVDDIGSVVLGFS
jgi:hypothetical protein